MPITIAGTTREWQKWITDYTTTTYITANDLTWDGWVGNNSFTGTTGSAVSVGNGHFDPWPQWTTITATTAATFRESQLLWNGWLNSAGTINLGARRLPERTEEQWRVIREENERLRAERDRLHAAARAEGRKLLELVLSPAQLLSLDRQGFFEVVGSEGGLFRIYHGVSGNVRQLVGGREINRLCVHPRLLDHRTDEGEGRGYLPTEDCLAAQALALLHDELGVVATANVHMGERHLRAVA